MCARTRRGSVQITAWSLLLGATIACGKGEDGPTGPPEQPPQNPPPTSELKGTPVYAVDLANRLLLFGTESPGTISRMVSITGLPVLKRIVGIDFRPSDGKLYGVGNDSRVYVVDTLTGVATPVGSVPFSPAIDPFEVHFGVGFDPKTERIRLIVAESAANYSISADDGTAVLETSVTFKPTDPNAGVTPRIAGLGYVPLGTGSAEILAAASSHGPGPLEGVLLALDADLGALVESIDPQTGEFDTIGEIDMVFARCAELKVGVNPDGAVKIIAVILTAAGNLAVKIDALTGKATPLGLVPDNDSAIQGIAWKPAASPAQAESSRESHFFALTQSRRTVRASTPTTSAVSSSLRPPKNRHSTTWDSRVSRSASRESASSSASTVSARSFEGSAASSSTTGRQLPPRFCAR
jgi:hypothetical protein